MRQLAVFAMFVMAVTMMVGLVRADQGEAVKCKAEGVHLCCAQCDNSVKAILGKDQGVSAVNVDRKAADKITFEAKSAKEAKDALDALEKGGFCCSVTAGAQKMTLTTTKVDL